MIKYNRKQLGAVMQAGRLSVGLTQTDVAVKLGYTSAQLVSQMERGVNAVPLKTMAELIKLYRLDPETVMQIVLDGQQESLREGLSLKKSKAL